MMVRQVMVVVAMGVAMVALAACARSPFAELDDDVAALLADRQAAAAVEPQRRADWPEAREVVSSESDRQGTPETLNPPAEALPVVTEPAEALPAVVLDLPGALAYAIEHGREYRNEKEALFIEGLNLLAEHHLWGPRFFSQFAATVSGTPESGDHDQVASLLNETGVRQRLPYGGEVSVSAVVNFISELRSEAGSEDPDETSGELTLRAVVPLLRGAGVVAREDLIQAQRDLTYAVRRFERFRRTYFVDIASDYFDLIEARSQIQTQQAQADQLEQLRRRNAALAESGRIPYLQVQEAENNLLAARNRLLNAQESFDLRLDSFKLRLGMTVATPLTIEPVELEIDTPELAVDVSVATALRLRLDLQTSRDRVADARRAVEVARDNTRGDLDLVGSLSLPSDPDVRDNPAQLSPGDGSYEVGVLYDVPLDRRVEQVRYRQAVIAHERAARDDALFRDQVALRVRQSVRSIETARFTLDLQERSLDIAQRRLRGVVIRDLDAFEFIRATDAIAEARTRLESARRDLRVAVLNYLLETGQVRVDRSGHWQAPAVLRAEMGVESS